MVPLPLETSPVMEEVAEAVVVGGDVVVLYVVRRVVLLVQRVVQRVVLVSSEPDADRVVEPVEAVVMLAEVVVEVTDLDVPTEVLGADLVQMAELTESAAVNGGRIDVFGAADSDAELVRLGLPCAETEAVVMVRMLRIVHSHGAMVLRLSGRVQVRNVIDTMRVPRSRISPRGGPPASMEAWHRWALCWVPGVWSAARTTRARSRRWPRPQTGTLATRMSSSVRPPVRSPAPRYARGCPGPISSRGRRAVLCRPKGRASSARSRR